MSLEHLADIDVMEGVLVRRPMHLLVTDYWSSLHMRRSSLVQAVLERIRVQLEVRQKRLDFIVVGHGRHRFEHHLLNLAEALMARTDRIYLMSWVSAQLGSFDLPALLGG